MVTIKDIAKATGISASTVSRVLNNNPAISEATRKIVMDAVEDLHYTPNRNAQNLVRQKNRTIAFMIPDIADNYFSTAAVGVEEILEKRGYDLVYYNTNRDMRRVYAFLEKAKENRYSGAFITPDFWEDGLIEVIHKIDMPVISLRRKSPFTVPEIPYVDSDHYMGFRDATGYLYSLGHRKIGMITAKTMIYSERQRGYEEVIQTCGLTPYIYCFDSPIKAPDRYQAGFVATKRFIEEDKVTAIIAADDRFAIGAIEYLSQEGYLIPDDISVMGCDDRPEGRLYPFQLSTVQQDIIELGRIAADLLLKMAESKENMATSVSLKPRLIIRKTTGNVKA